MTNTTEKIGHSTPEKKSYQDVRIDTKKDLQGLETTFTSPDTFLQNPSVERLHALFGYIYKQHNPEITRKYTEQIEKTTPYSTILQELQKTNNPINTVTLKNIITKHTDKLQDTVGVIQFFLMLQNQNLAHTVRYIDGMIGPKTLKGINTYRQQYSNKTVTIEAQKHGKEKNSEISLEELTTRKEIINHAEALIRNYSYMPQMCGGVIKQTLERFGVPISSLYVPNIFDQLTEFSSIKKYDSRKEIKQEDIEPGDIFVAGTTTSNHVSQFDHEGGKDHIGFLTGNMTDTQGPETIEALNTKMVGKYPLCYQINPYTKQDRTVWILKPNYSQRIENTSDNTVA